PLSAQPLDLQQAARDHLWMHFTRLADYRDAEVPVIMRGDGCYLEDVHGRRYLDALAGLFAVQIGYGYGEEMAEPAPSQLRELPCHRTGSSGHRRLVGRAQERAGLSPGDLTGVFFVPGAPAGGGAAGKLARQYHAACGERRWKAVARQIAYHGTTMGALSIN